MNPSPELLAAVRAAGGYYFILEDLPGSSSRGRAAQDFSATLLYLPAGWWHWLVGLTPWHVVYGGSFYPEQQAW
jgi:hypothetical protein